MKGQRLTFMLSTGSKQQKFLFFSTLEHKQQPSLHVSFDALSYLRAKHDPKIDNSQTTSLKALFRGEGLDPAWFLY